jgi:hypothetical protein
MQRALRELRNDIEELTPRTTSDLKATAGVFGLKPARITWRPADVTRYVVDSLICGVETTGATATTLASYVLGTNRAVKLVAVVVARAGATGNTYTTEITAAYKRASSTTITAIGSVTSGVTLNDAGAASWGATFDTVATESRIRLRVTGAASTRIYWCAEMRVQEVA